MGIFKAVSFIRELDRHDAVAPSYLDISLKHLQKLGAPFGMCTSVCPCMHSEMNVAICKTSILAARRFIYMGLDFGDDHAM